MFLTKAIKFLITRKRIPPKSKILDYFKVRRKIMPLPFFAQIEPTTRCNFNCVTCTRTTLNPSRLNRDLTLEEFKIILEQIPSLIEIKLQGMGEPFLNPHLEEILEYGKKQKISFYTITNGSVLKFYKHLLQYFDFLTISFDSSSKENFEKIRRGAKFEEIIENAKELIHYKIQHKLKTKIGFNTVVSHLNYQEINAIVELAKNLKLDYVGFVEVENWTTPLEKEFEIEREFIRESRKYSQKIKNIIENVIKKNNSFTQVSFYSSQKRKSICTWPFYRVFITVDGFVTPCCIRMNPQVFNFGNIFEETFEKIWNGEKYLKFRESLIKDLPNPVCDFCPD